MSLFSTLKTIRTRPLTYFIVAVGIALLSSYFLADSPFSKPVRSRKMHIQSIPMCKLGTKPLAFLPHHSSVRAGEGSGNNYAYLVTDDKTKDAVIIDPANPPEYATIAAPHRPTLQQADLVAGCCRR